MPEERSLGDPTPATEQPAAASPFGTPNPAPSEAQPLEIPAVSIIDTILQLDDFLSGDVRRAEKTARFCAKPWIEAEIDDLAYELEAITDSNGNALQGQEKAAVDVALRIQTKQAEYGAAFVKVRMGQRTGDDWKAFTTKWREAINQSPRPDEFWNALIEISALDPKITAEQAAGLRNKLGDPQMDALAKAAWEVNANSGVSIPKSPLSSYVLRQAARAQS